jgi:flagellar basal body-associated protein FliL
MAKTKDPKEAAQDGKAAASDPKKKSEGGGGNKGFIMMFSFVIIVQLVIIIILAYFYMNNSSEPKPDDYLEFKIWKQQGGIIAAQLNEQKVEEKKSKKTVKKEDEYDDEDEDEDDEHSSKGAVVIYQTDDLIINPKGARPGKFLMAQVGLAVKSEEIKKEFEETRKAQIYDILNGYLATQSLEYLADITKRDSLKIELKQRLNKAIKGKKIKDVFFSKYIVQ